MARLYFKKRETESWFKLKWFLFVVHILCPSGCFNLDNLQSQTTAKKKNAVNHSFKSLCFRLRKLLFSLHGALMERKNEHPHLQCLSVRDRAHLPFAAISPYYWWWAPKGDVIIKLSRFSSSGFKQHVCHVEAEVSACLSDTSNEPVNRWLFF